MSSAESSKSSVVPLVLIEMAIIFNNLTRAGYTAFLVLSMEDETFHA